MAENVEDIQRKEQNVPGQERALLSTTANTTKAPDPNQTSKDVFSKVKKSRTEQAVARLIVRF